MVVTLGDMAPQVEKQLNEINPLMTRHILREPKARNTAAAVAMAAVYVQDKFGDDAVMWVLPADHHISDEKAMAVAFDEAMKAAQADYLVTFGIEPTRAETGYGYIETGARLGIENGTACAVTQFIEKPSRDKAQALIDARNNLWNSGMFLFRAESVLRNFHRYAVDILNIIQQAKSEIILTASISGDVYARVPELPFDKAIMEKSDRVAVVPCNIGWSDIGSWESLWEITAKDDRGNVVQGDGITEGCNNIFIRGGDKLVVCVDIDDVVVVDAGDAIVIMKKSASDQLKTVVSTLKKQNRIEVKQPASVVKQASSQQENVIDYKEAVGV